MGDRRPRRRLPGLDLAGLACSRRLEWLHQATRRKTICCQCSRANCVGTEATSFTKLLSLMTGPWCLFPFHQPVFSWGWSFGDVGGLVDPEKVMGISGQCGNFVGSCFMLYDYGFMSAHWEKTLDYLCCNVEYFALPQSKLHLISFGQKKNNCILRSKVFFASDFSLIITQNLTLQN